MKTMKKSIGLAKMVIKKELKNDIKAYFLINKTYDHNLKLMAHKPVDKTQEDTLCPKPIHVGSGATPDLAVISAYFDPIEINDPVVPLTRRDSHDTGQPTSDATKHQFVESTP
jgi:hypothetical protein